jgi:arylsulfatase A-like enzyme
MKMRWLKFFPCFALATVLLNLVVAFSSAAATERPNIVFILTDDMGYGDVACYGGKFVPTPNIDQLAKEGTKFTQYYVASPICSPSRAGLLTGTFPAHWKIHTYLQTRAGNRAAHQADFLDSKAPSVARALKAAGYATGHFGKWHMGGGRDVKNAPPFSAYGFDEHASTWESPDPDPNLTSGDWIWSANDKVKRWDRTAYFVDRSLDFLKRHKGQPCYVNLWPDDVHTPWVPDGSDLHKQRRDTDDSEGSFIEVLREYDKQVGRFMAGLKQLGLDEKTIVVFSSDNGPAPDFDNTRCGGLRGRKASLYEGGSREPFIVRWTDKTPAGRIDDKTVIDAVDLFPTFCKLAGASLPRNAHLDGADVSKSFFGQNIERATPLFWEFGGRKGSGRPPGKNVSPNVAVREGKWKLLINDDGSALELYDLDADQNETNNVAEQNPTIAKRLSASALRWRKQQP